MPPQPHKINLKIKKKNITKNYQNKSTHHPYYGILYGGKSCIVFFLKHEHNQTHTRSQKKMYTHTHNHDC